MAANDKDLPNVSTTGISVGFSQGPLGWAHNNFAWRDVVSWIRGNHNIRFGADVDRQRGEQNRSLNITRPSFSFYFSVLGLTGLRQLWLTFAPLLADGAAYTPQEWNAVFTNWMVTDPSGKRSLKIAHPTKSVRVGSRDSWSSYSGAGWQLQDGIYYWRGFLKRSKTTGDKVTIQYHCQYTHDLYLGTALYKDKGIAGIKLDGDAETDLDTYLNAEPEAVTRRKVRSNVAAGAHTVEIRVKGTKNVSSSDYWVYFDFLEAAVPDDVQDPAQTYSNRFISTDYDTP